MRKLTLPPWPLDTDVIELERVIAFCERFSVTIDKFNDGLTPRDLEYIINEFDSVSVRNMLQSQDLLISEIDAGKQRLAETQGKLKLLATLEDRPKECEIDTCPFIANAVIVKNELQGDIVETLSLIQDTNLGLSEKVAEIQSRIDYHNTMSYKKVELDAIRREISEISYILRKYYPQFIENFEFMVLNMNTFSFIREHKKVTDVANLLRMLAVEKQQNQLLELEYRNYREKVQLLNSSRNMLTKLEKSQAELIETIARAKSDMDSYSSTISSLETKVNNETEYLAIYLRYKKLLEEYTVIKEQVAEFEKK